MSGRSVFGTSPTTRCSIWSGCWCTARTRSARTPARSPASHRSASPRPTTSTRSSPWTPTACSTRRSSWTPRPSAGCCVRARTSSPRADSSIRQRTSPPMARRSAHACQDGGTSFHAGGIHPGYAGDILPLTLARVMSRIDQIRVYEVVNILTDAPLDHIDWMGFGKDKDKFLSEPTILGLGVPFFAQSMYMIADGLGVTHRRGDRRGREGRRRDRGHPARVGRDTPRHGRRAAPRMDGLGRRQTRSSSSTRST